MLVALTPATVLIQNSEHNCNRHLDTDVASLADSNGDSHNATYEIINPVHIQNSTKKDAEMTLPAEKENVSRLIKTNDNSPEIFYFGSWSESTNTSSFKNNHHLSDVQYANCVFTFNKTVVRWIGSKASNHGVADVYIDGVFQKSIDSYSDKELTNQVLFERKGLSNDRIHTIKIVVKKEKDSMSSGYYQDIDYFESIEPVNFLEQYKASSASEFKDIVSGAKPYLAPAEWMPVAYKAEAPANGVILQAGVFNDCYTRNIAYLNHCFASPTFCDGEGWTAWLPGSNEGRMLQGAGNTLRWGERGDMRDIVNTIVNRIDSRQRADGYSNYYPERDSYSCLWSVNLIDGKRNLQSKDLVNSERKNYDRVFWTRGLLDAGNAGNDKAYSVVRNFYDWFNDCSYLNKMLDGSNSTNGLPGGGLVYLSPAGKSKDMVVTERYFDQDYWIKELINENPLCITYYQITNSHCYELLGLEAFLDEYRATGASKYIDAVKGGWNTYNDNFKHIGGLTAICEGHTYPPQSYYLEHNRHTGETCGGVFWININSRLMKLYPAEEKYAAEVEKVIYNVIMASQDDKGYIRYHNLLNGVMKRAGCANTCCECSSVGLIAKLPEYIYSIADDGIYINLFAASTISWEQDNEILGLAMNTQFPKSEDVSISFKGSSSKKMKIRVRIPSWAEGDVKVNVNETTAVTGKPGTYVTIDRIWKDNDMISFDLPMSFRMHKYTGLSQDKEYDKYALTYGPLLMSLVGDSADSTLNIPAIKLIENLKPITGDPLQFDLNAQLKFDLNGKPGCKYMPFFQVQEGEKFNCYPTID